MDEQSKVSEISSFPAFVSIARIGESYYFRVKGMGDTLEVISESLYYELMRVKDNTTFKGAKK